MLRKAAEVPADELVIDLEDAVVASEKDAARQRLLSTLEWIGAGGASLAVRINAPRSPWCHRDVEALAAAPPALRSIVVPKVESAGDIAFLERLLDGVEAAAGRALPLRLQVLIESAAGLSRVDEIVTASERVESLILGYADLATSLGRPSRGDLDSWRGAQERLLLAARTGLVQAIDGPHFEIADESGLRAAAERAAALGFDGKWAIHPVQLPTIDAAFTPGKEQVEHAHAVLLALREADGGAGAVRLDGEMVDEAMAVAARRIIARAGEG
jgi:citrate lyase subunit beta/citryl-CoA lyase